MFAGEYTHPLDDKNRVVFPARLRDSLLAEKLPMGFYLTRGFDGSLLLFAKEEWDVMANSISALPSTRAEWRNFKRLFFSKAVHLTLDRQGRILIPERHKAMVGIEKEVSFVGVGEHVEVWPREQYEKHEEEISKSYEEIAEKLFFKQGPEEADLGSS